MMRKARPFHPPANRESFKDLLIFEERLKQNAERSSPSSSISLVFKLTPKAEYRLQKQRRKYQGFLLSLIAVILYLAYIVFLQPSIYSLVHYSNVACLLVAATTLILFFATGMYSDKIAYAYKFVPQANRALRPFNIYLNTRHKSRFSFLLNFFNSSSSSSTTTPRSRNSSIASPSISRTSSGRSIASSSSSSNSVSQGVEAQRLSLSRQTSASSIQSHTSFRSTGALRSASPSPASSPSSSPPSSPKIPTISLPTTSTPDDGPVTRAPPPSSSSSLQSTTPRPTGVPIPPIPPAQNPRGELIFSNRVNPTFREGYERYRGEWERRRKENKEIEYQRKRSTSWWKVWSWGTTRMKSRGNEFGGGGKTEKNLQQEEEEKDRGRNRNAKTNGLDSISADSSRLNSRANSTERRREDEGQDAKTAAEALLSTVSTPQSSTTPLGSLLPSTSSPGPDDSHSSSAYPATLAPLDRDDPSSTSTPPPQSNSSPSSSAPSRRTTTTETSLKPSHQVHSRIRAESFSELLELEAANEEENEVGGGGPPGMPELTRTSSCR